MTSRIKLRRFCLLLSYSGKKYLGMQRNPGTNTVEECLLLALKNSEMIPEEHYIRPQLMYFQRAARTDKSVSAIKQIVSIKISESIVDRLDDINKLLPSDIRLMDCKKVTQSFDAKNYCDARTYSYLMPSFALSPKTQGINESYRVSDDILKTFNSILEGYVGTHIFHNFTSGKSFKDDSSVRVIRFMNCSDPFFPCNQKELEFVTIRVKGQSFMMHQIRKMIGLAIAVIRGYATEDHIKLSMEEPYMDVPKAPGLGLMLEEAHFDRYNRKFGGDGHHQPIEWGSANDAIDKFKNEFIYPVVVETEKEEKSMLNWLATLELHTFGNDRTTNRQPHKNSYTKSSDNLLNASNVITNDSEGPDELPDTKRMKLDNEDEKKTRVRELTSEAIVEAKT